TCFALDLKAAADPAKCLQSFFDGRARHFSSKGDGCGGKSIQYIVPPRERKANLCHFLAEMRDAKFHAAVNVGDVAGDPGCCPVQAVRFDRTKRFFNHPVDGSRERNIVLPGHNSSATGEQIYETAKLQFDGWKIGVNIGVIKFQRGDDEFVGMIVEKFRAFVEKRGVVFVAFQNELAAAAQTITFSKILRQAANQEIRAASGDVQNPRKHRSGGGFSVRAGYDE